MTNDMTTNEQAGGRKRSNPWKGITSSWHMCACWPAPKEKPEPDPAKVLHARREPEGGTVSALDLSQFEGMTLPKAAEEAAWTTRDMLDSPREVIIDSVTKSLWPFFDPLIAEVKRQAEQIAELERDRERVDWLLANVPGSAFRAMGIVYSDGAKRADLDAAMQTNPER